MQMNKATTQQGEWQQEGFNSGIYEHVSPGSSKEHTGSGGVAGMARSPDTLKIANSSRNAWSKLQYALKICQSEQGFKVKAAECINDEDRTPTQLTNYLP
jgi:hypothetical protein